MRRTNFLIIITAVFSAITSPAQENKEPKKESLYFPGEEWEAYTDPFQLGYNVEKLSAAKKHFDSINAAAVLVLYKGKILVNWGDNTRRFRSASIRKSFLSALLGMAVAEKRLSIEDRIDRFSIQGVEGLTELEKKATIRDLLTSSSGIYLPAAYEPEVWTKNKPERESNFPGTTWYYNNWDFNGLGALYDHISQSSMATDFKNKIADKIGMQDFRSTLDFKYFYEKNIPVPAYLFKMSSRDMARFGLLYLRNGKWKNEQLISESWISQSTTKKMTPWEGVGYGFLWWTTHLKNGPPVFYANGTGVQSILIIPEEDIVMVFRANTYLGPEVPNGAEFELMNRILEAKTAKEQDDIETRNVVWNQSYTNSSDIVDFQNWVGRYRNNIARNIDIEMVDRQLVLKTKIADFLMYPIGKNRCWVEDLNVTATMESSGIEEPNSTLTRDELRLFK